MAWDTDTTVTVVLVGEPGLFRQALVSLLSRQDDITVLADVDGVADVPAPAPDTVVVDLDHVDAPSAFHDLHARLPDVPIIALVRNQQTTQLRALLTDPELMPVLAVVDKAGPAARLVEAVLAAARGDLVVDGTAAVAALGGEPNPFTTREQEVLRLVAAGASNREISTSLHLAPGTVRNYLSNAITKTRARNRVDAIRIAQEASWI
jgi:two-component system, NarL family, response regulator DesR